VAFLTAREADLVIYHASELATPVGPAPLTGHRLGQLKVIRDGAVAIKDGLIVAVGRTREIRRFFEAQDELDVSGMTVVPGFVDPHTHLVFGPEGFRPEELEMKIRGLTYMEILARGGGIMRTVRATRATTEEGLARECLRRLDLMLLHGTTTVEAKSGYGLTVEDELKCLRALRKADEKHPVDVVPTFLGAHAVPPEYEGRPDDYVELVISEMLPKVAEGKLASFCDVFCEKGVFSREHAKAILTTGLKCGLKPKLHADEFSDTGGASLAAELKAASADHLLCSSEGGLRAMAKAGVAGVLLPASPLTTMLGRFADARRMIELGVPAALGTDFNPNCPVENLQAVMALACYCMKMTQAEALSAATLNAAYAIGLSDRVGSIEVGKKADLVVLNVPGHEHLGYRLGSNLVVHVVKSGQLVVEDGKLSYRGLGSSPGGSCQTVCVPGRGRPW